MCKTQLRLWLKYAVVTGNILFIIWVTHNAMEAHFAGTIYEILSYIVLTVLLLLNSFLLLANPSKKSKQ
jgi:hypothetical protein